MVMLAALAWTSAAAAQQAAVAPGATLRAAYLGTNPAQAVTDPATGELRGVAIDLARELGRRLGLPVVLDPLQSPQQVMDAVREGHADVGFVAYNPERAGPVAFSHPYLLVQQTFVVRDDSTIRSVADIDRPNQTIGVTKGDSIALYLARTLKQAQLVPLEGAAPAEPFRLVAAGTLDAWGANRQRLTDALGGQSGLRLLPDDLYGVEQTMIVAAGKPDALRVVNEFLEEARASGFISAAITRSGVIGITVAPAR